MRRHAVTLQTTDPTKFNPLRTTEWILILHLADAALLQLNELNTVEPYLDQVEVKSAQLSQQDCNMPPPS